MVENKGSNVLYNKINITFPDWVIVKNIIPRNMIINLSCSSVDNHIPRDDIFDYHPIRDVIFIYYSLMFFIAYAFKGQVHVFAGRVKIVSHWSCRTSAILKHI